jgi:hypothetical protein
MRRVKPSISKDNNMEYKLIADANSTKFAEQITAALSEGFELYGQPFTRDGFYEERDRDGQRSEFNYRPMWAQALIRGEK